MFIGELLSPDFLFLKPNFQWRSPLKILGVSNANLGVFNKNIVVSNENLGVSNENLGVSRKLLGFSN